METKTCSITDDEIKKLIEWHGSRLDHDDFKDRIERIVYLNKRLSAKPKEETKMTDTKADAIGAASMGW
jgi:hypothetical protein